MGKRLRFRFNKTGAIKYLSHLDMVNIIIRAMRRADIKVEYSRGFNPKPRITFGPPIPLGAESEAEYADVCLEEGLSPEDFISRMNCQLEGRVTISCTREIPGKVKNLMSQVDIAEYEISLSGADTAGIPEELIGRAAEDPVIDDSIYGAAVESAQGQGQDKIVLYGYAKTAKDRNKKVFKLRDFLKALKMLLDSRDMQIKRVVRKQLFVLKGDKKLTPFEVF